MAAIRYEIDDVVFAAARSTADWIAAFYPHIIVSVDRNAAHLVSEEDDADALRMIWRTALANEVLLVRGAAHRAGVIAGLVA